MPNGISSNGPRPPAPAVRRESQRPTAARARSDNFGGARLKLAVAGEIPGYHLYWANDEAGEVEQLLYEGFEFVSPDEVRMKSAVVADVDTANKISKYVGKDEQGAPLRAFLLKCTDELWEERQAIIQEQPDAWEGAIQSGRATDVEKTYNPKGADIAIERVTQTRS